MAQDDRPAALQQADPAHLELRLQALTVAAVNVCEGGKGPVLRQALPSQNRHRHLHSVPRLSKLKLALELLLPARRQTRADVLLEEEEGLVRKRHVELLPGGKRAGDRNSQRLSCEVAVRSWSDGGAAVRDRERDNRRRPQLYRLSITVMLERQSRKREP
eukprot:751422-Hanusia_phi.AAC.9